ncbi:SUMF1/EgtB/PvdO family nonheme iron enzyme [Stieleria varia]|uniref:Serine/threonine-protein kinase pkn1 n=1 Tax=Stieleria varia TaxID=2528005 RepID=A0A5C6ANX9_9BACT|nr:SUMF1/EgtB/PvdO family nonheme iron enzyme [Stieleria varia]TWU00969.1 Serine/threonine-protein kinase pkn1 [Stieleria varia]
MTNQIKKLTDPSASLWSAAAACDEIRSFKIRRKNRKQMIRHGFAITTTLALLALIALVGWRAHQNSQLRSLSNQYSVQRRMLGTLQSQKNPSVERLLREADLLHDASLQPDSNTPVENIRNAINLVDQAEKLDVELTRLGKLHKPIGETLTQTAWLEQSASIASRVVELKERYMQIGRQLDDGEIDQAESSLMLLLSDVGSAERDNAKASQADGLREEWQQAQKSVPERLENDPELWTINRLASQAEQGFNQGDWQNARSLFGQALTRMSDFLGSNLSQEEWRSIEQRNAKLARVLRGESTTAEGVTTPKNDPPMQTVAVADSVEKVKPNTVKPAALNATIELSETAESPAGTPAAFEQAFAEFLGSVGGRTKAVLNAKTPVADEDLSKLNQQISQNQIRLATEISLLDESRAQILSEIAKDLVTERKEYEELKRLTKVNDPEVVSVAKSIERLQRRRDRLVESNKRHQNDWAKNEAPQLAATEIMRIGAGLLAAMRADEHEELMYRTVAEHYRPGGDDYPMVWIEPGKLTDVQARSLVGNQKLDQAMEIESPFWIGASEVTLAMALSWLNDPEVELKGEWGRMTFGKSPIVDVDGQYQINPKSPFSQSPQQPLVGISPAGAQAYCEWCSHRDPQYDYRLPTEIEWEYAARAGTATPYFWGPKEDGVRANVRGTAIRGTNRSGRFLGLTSKVASYPANPWGLHDTTGNVWELCGKPSAATHPNCSAPRMRRGQVDEHVIRGGSWSSLPVDSQVSSRSFAEDTERSRSLGLRLVAIPKRTQRVEPESLAQILGRVADGQPRPNAGTYTGQRRNLSSIEVQEISLIVSEEVVVETTGVIEGPESLSRLKNLWVRDYDHRLERGGLAVYASQPDQKQWFVVVEVDGKSFRGCVFGNPSDSDSLEDWIANSNRQCESVSMNLASDTTWVDSASSEAAPAVRKNWRTLLAEYAPGCLSRPLAAITPHLSRRPTGELYELGLYGAQLTPEIIQLINLHHRSVSNIALMKSNVNDVMLGQLAPLNRIRVLSVWGTEISPVGLSLICEQFPRLRHLGLNATQTMTPEASVQLPKLQELQSLSAGWTGCTDRSILPLMQMPSLTKLNLEGNKFTDDALATLARCKSLEEIRLDTGQSKFSKAAITKLTQALPNCVLAIE